MVEKNGIIDRILAGETAVFEQLVTDYQRLVNHVVFRMIPDDHDRPDICQDIFMRVYRNLGNFRADARLSTWIARIAYNRCLDYLGRKKISVTAEPLEEAARFIAGNEPRPDEQAVGQNRREVLEQAIGQLPVQYRMIITLYHLDEMSYEEIGKIMKLPIGTVKSYLFRARRQLKETLEARYLREEL
nr:sigma-70 family RNA polymerase sigma factor [candidate division Zixibacteria bacterium]